MSKKPEAALIPSAALVTSSVLDTQLYAQRVIGNGTDWLSALSLSKPGLETSRVNARYGDAGKAGWLPVPDVLIFNQAKLGIASDELNVLLNLMAHYYRRDAMPFVRPNVIAKRMGVSTRSVQRAIAKLRRKKLITKAAGPQRQVVHDLTPLITKLQPLAKERLHLQAARRATLEEQAALAAPS